MTTIERKRCLPFCQANYRDAIEPLEPRQMFTVKSVAPPQVIPNDEVWSFQWNMRQVHAPEAWKITTGSSRVVVSINDSGVDYTHPDLYRNIWINQKEIPFKIGKNGLTDADSDGLITFWDLNAKDKKGKLLNATFVRDRNGTGYIDGGDLLADPAWADGKDEGHNGYRDDLIGWDFVNNDNDPMDLDPEFSHGTSIASVIGAEGNNGYLMAGMNWRVQIMPIVNSGADNSVEEKHAVDAIYYSANNGARISNNSYTGTPDDTEAPDLLLRAVDHARKLGQLFVAAAGNDALDADIEPQLPAAYSLPNIISVAATGSNNFDTRAYDLEPSESDHLSYFSNYGKKTVDLGAPGWDVPGYFAAPFEIERFPDGSRHIYGFDGTSYAAPHVVGAAALLLAKHPNLNYADLKRLILDNVDPLTDLKGKTVTGGRLNVYRALLAADKPKGWCAPLATAITKLIDLIRKHWAAIEETLFGRTAPK